MSFAHRDVFQRYHEQNFPKIHCRDLLSKFTTFDSSRKFLFNQIQVIITLFHPIRDSSGIQIYRGLILEVFFFDRQAIYVHYSTHTRNNELDYYLIMCF